MFLKKPFFFCHTFLLMTQNLFSSLNISQTNSYEWNNLLISYYKFYENIVIIVPDYKNNDIGIIINFESSYLFIKIFKYNDVSSYTYFSREGGMFGSCELPNQEKAEGKTFNDIRDYIFYNNYLFYSIKNDDKIFYCCHFVDGDGEEYKIMITDDSDLAKEDNINFNEDFRIIKFNSDDSNNIYITVQCELIESESGNYYYVLYCFNLLAINPDLIRDEILYIDYSMLSKILITDNSKIQFFNNFHYNRCYYKNEIKNGDKIEHKIYKCDNIKDISNNSVEIYTLPDKYTNLYVYENYLTYYGNNKIYLVDLSKIKDNSDMVTIIKEFKPDNKLLTLAINKKLIAYKNNDESVYSYFPLQPFNKYSINSLINTNIEMNNIINEIKDNTEILNNVNKSLLTLIESFETLQNLLKELLKVDDYGTKRTIAELILNIKRSNESIISNQSTIQGKINDVDKSVTDQTSGITDKMEKLFTSVDMHQKRRVIGEETYHINDRMMINIDWLIKIKDAIDAIDKKIKAE